MSGSSDPPLIDYDLILDNPTGIYHPGDQLSGRVVIKIQDDIPLYGVQLWILGQSDVSWSDKPDGRRKLFDYEVYMQDCLILWGQDPKALSEANAESKLAAGAYEFPFDYKLRQNLPSSFESHDLRLKGRVHFLIRAKLDSPVTNFQLRRDRIIIVLQTLDLNKEPNVKENVQLRKEKTLVCTSCCCCCCCCSGHSGVISCSLRLDRTGYVPGEDINLDAEIQNLSVKEISTSYVTMQQMVQIQTKGSNRSSASDIFRISGGKIKPGDSAFYHDIIHIPPLPPSRLDGCGIIDIEYIIAVGVLPAGLTTPLEVSVPVIIGTVPINDLIASEVTMAPSFSRYSHSSGEIEDYREDDYRNGKYQHVYKYYKCVLKHPDQRPA